MPATIARWTGTQISLSAMTRATPTGSCSGVTGCTRFPTPPRTAPTIAEPPPILNTHCCSLMAVPGPVPPDSPLRSCHGPGAGGSCARGVLLAGGEQLVQQWLHLGHRQGEGTEPAGQRAADVPARRRDHVAAAAVPDDRVGDASPTGDDAGGQPRRDGVEVPAAAARPGHRPDRCCQRLEPAERGRWSRRRAHPASGGVRWAARSLAARTSTPGCSTAAATCCRRRQGGAAQPRERPARRTPGRCRAGWRHSTNDPSQSSIETARPVTVRYDVEMAGQGGASLPTGARTSLPRHAAVPVGDLREVVRHTARWPGWSPRGWAPGAAWSPVGAGQRRDGGVGGGLAAHAHLRWGWGRPNIALALDGYGGPRGTSTQPTDNAGHAGQRAVRWGMRG